MKLSNAKNTEIISEMLVPTQKHAKALLRMVAPQRNVYKHILCNTSTTKNVLHMLLVQLSLASFWIAAFFP